MKILNALILQQILKIIWCHCGSQQWNWKKWHFLWEAIHNFSKSICCSKISYTFSSSTLPVTIWKYALCDGPSLEYRFPEGRAIVDQGVFSSCTLLCSINICPQKESIRLLRRLNWVTVGWMVQRTNFPFCCDSKKRRYLFCVCVYVNQSFMALGMPEAVFQHFLLLCPVFSDPFIHSRKGADRTPPLLSLIFRQGSRLATQGDTHTWWQVISLS